MDEEKSKLEKKVEEGIYGQPEIKKGEKNRFLGEFKERVIKYLTYDQVVEEGVYPEIEEALKNPAAKKMVIDREVDMSYANDYIELAQKENISFKRAHSPSFKGEVALVVVSNKAVNVKKRKVINREERLKKKGISDNIIKNKGAKLCKDCWNELKEKAPEELKNYEKMTWFDKISGIKCINCK
ncbi:MAG: YueI family protein [Halanaerobiaceae bacterium]